jgi:hypothetical protein
MTSPPPSTPLRGAAEDDDEDLLFSPGPFPASLFSPPLTGAIPPITPTENNNNNNQSVVPESSKADQRHVFPPIQLGAIEKVGPVCKENDLFLFGPVFEKRVAEREVEELNRELCHVVRTTIPTLATVMRQRIGLCICSLSLDERVHLDVSRCSETWLVARDRSTISNAVNGLFLRSHPPKLKHVHVKAVTLHRGYLCRLALEVKVTRGKNLQLDLVTGEAWDSVAITEVGAAMTQLSKAHDDLTLLSEGDVLLLDPSRIAQSLVHTIIEAEARIHVAMHVMGEGAERIKRALVHATRAVKVEVEVVLGGIAIRVTLYGDDDNQGSKREQAEEDEVDAARVFIPVPQWTELQQNIASILECSTRMKDLLGTILGSVM